MYKNSRWAYKTLGHLAGEDNTAWNMERYGEDLCLTVVQYKLIKNLKSSLGYYLLTYLAQYINLK